VYSHPTVQWYTRTFYSFRNLSLYPLINLSSQVSLLFCLLTITLFSTSAIVNFHSHHHKWQGLHSFQWLYSIPLYISFTHPLVDVQFNFFYLFDIKNTATVNTGVKPSWHNDFICFGYIPKFSGISGSHGSPVFNFFLRELPHSFLYWI
jgi:hypothetical protein